MPRITAFFVSLRNCVTHCSPAHISDWVSSSLLLPFLCLIVPIALELQCACIHGPIWLSPFTASFFIHSLCTLDSMSIYSLHPKYLKSVYSLSSVAACQSQPGMEAYIHLDHDVVWQLNAAGEIHVGGGYQH